MVSCLFKGETVSAHPPSWPAELGNNQDYTLFQRRWSEGSQTKAVDISTPEPVKSSQDGKMDGYQSSLIASDTLGLSRT